MTKEKLKIDFRMIEQEIKEDSFINNEGLSNEVAYYIYHYNPKYELLVRDYVDKMAKKYPIGKKALSIVHIDLYDEMIHYIENRGLLEKAYDMEEEYGYSYLHRSISNLLRMDLEESFFVDLIKTKTQELEGNYVVFISGIGKAYPIVRAHHILNNLHLNYDKAPVIFFYPGSFTGQSLSLLNIINDQNYYRAFSLNNRLALKEEENVN